MFVFQALFLGSLVYAGGRLAAFRRSAKAAQPQAAAILETPPLKSKNLLEAMPDREGSGLRVSSAALGLSVAGAVLCAPLFSLASLPATFFVFAPTFGQAWRSLGQRRLDTHVIEAARVAVCTAMGYTVVASVDALFHSLSQRALCRSREQLRETLESSLGQAADSAWVDCDGVELEVQFADLHMGEVLILRAGDRLCVDGVVLAGCAEVAFGYDTRHSLEKRVGDRLRRGDRLLSGGVFLKVETAYQAFPDPSNALQDAVSAPTVMGRLGEHLSQRMAAWMLASFALSTPLIGVSRAAVFLTAGFGAQMRKLGPHAACHFIGFAASHGLFIREPCALERANLVNAVIINARLLTGPARPHAAKLMQALNQRLWPAANGLASPFGVYAMAESEEEGRVLAEQLDLRGYFVEPPGAARAELLKNLQLAGRLVCYVTEQGCDAEALGMAWVAVAVGEPGELASEPAHMVLADASLSGLPGVFDLAAAFAAKQQFNLLVPVAGDIASVFASLLLRSGAASSLLIAYAGLWAGIVQSKWPPDSPVFSPAMAQPISPVWRP
jgi:cation transport ATPase